jgi:predicted nucleic acid-binding Zn ribbon protein
MNQTAGQIADHARSSRLEDEMTWVNTPDKRRCDTCGTVVNHWILQRDHGHKAAELIFCPVCSPGVKSMFTSPKKASGAA